MTLALMTLPASSASAQIIQGTIVTRGSAQPVAGLFVVLTDATGADVARTLSDRAGRFVLPAPRAATYRVAIRSIGWHAWSSPPIALDVGQTLQYRVEYSLRPLALAEVRVAGVPRCAADADSSERIPRLWEKVLRALEVVSWTQREPALRLRWHRYQRRLHPETLEVLDQERVPQEGLYAGSPFVSRPAEDLAGSGYIRRDSVGDWKFLAPDPDALLSDWFVRDHCFRLLAHPSESRVIGLGFRSVRQDTVFDIEGTLWIDSATSELRRLDFRYARLPWRWLRTDRVGGEIEFGRLPTGAWIIRRWHIRMPVVQVRWSTSGWVSGTRAQLVAFQEVGGTVWDVRTREGDPVATEGDGSLSGVVYDSTAGRPLAGAGVMLVGTAFTAASDPQGRFVFEALPPSAYQVTFDHPMLDSLLGADPVRGVYVGAGTRTEVTLAIPPRERLRSTLCPGIGPSDALLGGFVRPPASGWDPRDAVVSLSWRRPDDSTQLARLDVTVDATGRYILCRAPTGVALSIGATDGAAALIHLSALSPGSLTRVDIALRY